MDAWRQSQLDEGKKKIRADMEANGELDGLTEQQIDDKIAGSAQYKASVARIRYLHRIRGGYIIYINCKSPQTWPLTPNQRIVYPEIEASGAVLTGSGKPGIKGGT